MASDITGGGDIRLDLTQSIPFPDNSVELIYSSHVLEHFSYPIPMIHLLRECHRILKPGGTLRVAVPDARIFLNAYVDPGSFDKARFCSLDVGLSYKSKIDYVNFIAYMGGEHKHLFDEENLVLVLAEAGFRDVCIRVFDPEVDLEVRRHESIYAQAVK
ncbi:MAG: methyltransferase domain-containing protein [Acidobacteriota bacterium]